MKSSVETTPALTDQLTLTREYVFVYPESDKAASKLARSLKENVFEQFDMNLAVQNDVTVEGESISEKEILIGETNRQESIDAYKVLEKNEWSVSVKDNKIVIAGKSGAALVDAVDYFVSTYLKGQTVFAVEKDLA